MRVLNIHGADDVRLDPKAPPQAGPNDVIVNVKACGICGSDLSYIKWGGINRPEGGVTPIGHEAAGEVAVIGSNIQGLRVGQRVVINPMLTSTFIGSGGPEGAFTEQVLVGDAQVGETLLPIPDDLPFEIAALTEPLAVAMHSVNRAKVKPGDHVALFGCGPIGLGIVLWLVDRGIDVVAIDLSPERLERAKALGAKDVINPAKEDLRARLTEIYGAVPAMFDDAVDVDAFIDAAGAPNIVNDVLAMGKRHAKLIVTAAYIKSVEINFSAMLINEMSVTTALGYPTEMPEVLASLPRVKDKAAAMISHRYAFDDVLQALKVAATPQSAKVMIAMGDAG